MAWRTVKGLQQSPLASGRRTHNDRTMKKQFRKVAILGRHTDRRVRGPMQTLAEHLTKAGVAVFAADDMSFDISATLLPETELPDNADLVITIGGDGTMLYAGQLARNAGVPVLGEEALDGRDGGLLDQVRQLVPGLVAESVVGRHFVLGVVSRRVTGEGALLACRAAPSGSDSSGRPVPE